MKYIEYLYTYGKNTYNKCITAGIGTYFIYDNQSQNTELKKRINFTNQEIYIGHNKWGSTE